MSSTNRKFLYDNFLVFLGFPCQFPRIFAVQSINCTIIALAQCLSGRAVASLHNRNSVKIIQLSSGNNQSRRTREFDSLGSPNASQSLIRLYFFCQFLILYFHVMLSYVIITMR